MTRTTSILGAAALLGLVAAPSFAGTVSVVKNNTDQENASDYKDVKTSGAMMAGTTATVSYVGGATQTYTWAAIPADGSTAGGVSGGGFSLEVKGADTYNDPFTLMNSGTPITNIFLDGFPGNTLFDSTNPSPGTAGSPGEDFKVVSGGAPYNITATYSGEVAIPPNPAVGDVYRYLNINFGPNGFTGTGNNGLSFLADTDTVGQVSTVPEPAPFTIVGVGVVMMAGLIARKRRSLKA